MRRAFTFMGLCLALNGGGVAAAQSAPPPYARPPDLHVERAQEQPERALAQHTFPVAEYSPTPFTLTSFAMRVGVERSQVPNYAQLASLLNADGQTKIDLTSLQVAEAFDASVQVHDRVSIAGAAYGRARVGANRPSLLNAGVDFMYGGNLSVLVKLLRTRQFQLSVRGAFGASTGQLAAIGILFSDLSKIADQTITQTKNAGLSQEDAAQQLRAAFQAATAELMTPFSTWTASGALVMALGFNPYLGLQASLGFATDHTTYNLTRYQTDSNTLLHYDRSLQTLRPTATLALDFDAEPARIPLDFMVEYQLAPSWVKTTSQGSEVTQSTVEQLLALALYYSGRKDLQLGITGVWVFGQTPLLGENSQPSGHPFEIAGRLIFRYIW
jgi:hypothetical protein